jgi:hypothetical protein
LESTRLAQRSIMSRAVLAPVDLDTGGVTYRVPTGWTIATLLPLLNTSAAPGLERWDPHAGIATGWPIRTLYPRRRWLRPSATVATPARRSRSRWRR